MLHAAALDAVLRALFSQTAESEETSFVDLARSYGRGPGRPNPLDVFAKTEDDYRWATLGRRSFRAAREQAVGTPVARRRRDPEFGARGNLLDLLLAAREPDSGNGLSDAEVGDQIATLLFAGFETTSRLLFWAAYLLTLDADEQARVRAELHAFPPNRASRLEDLDHWPRLRQLLFETLRLYPPAPNIVRVAREPDNVVGQVLAPGAQVWISPWVMHRHRRFWAQPTAFFPDRFAGQTAPWTTGAFIPFGMGPRVCIGSTFALAEAQIVLAYLVHNFRFGLRQDRPVIPAATITIAPDHEPDFQIERV